MENLTASLDYRKQSLVYGRVLHDDGKLEYLRLLTFCKNETDQQGVRASEYKRRSAPKVDSSKIPREGCIKRADVLPFCQLRWLLPSRLLRSRPISMVWSLGAKVSWSNEVSVFTTRTEGHTLVRRIIRTVRDAGQGN